MLIDWCVLYINRKEILLDLTTWANAHNGYVHLTFATVLPLFYLLPYISHTLTVLSWHALELLRDFDRRRTHFIVIPL